jgi:hypothetical protein
LVFFFGRRLHTSAYLRESLVEGAKQQELKPLLQELHDRAMAGPLDPSQPPPDEYGPLGRLWEPHRYPFASADKPPDESPGAKEERAQRLAEVKKWETEERTRYEQERQKVVMEAARRAEKRIPQSIDMALLGGGWTFLLEFSTVMVIIFTLLILAILRTLEGREIATILAAIAGYVLGKASAGAAKTQTESQAGQPPIPRGQPASGVHTNAGGQ